MNPLIQLRKATPLFLIALLVACFALPQRAQAVSPAPDGGYPGGNTAEGQAALLSLTTGGFNTAVGFLSLKSNTAGNFNTAVGAGTLLSNIGDPAHSAGIDNTAIGGGALLSNTTGGRNTANGAVALARNTTGSRNNAVGFEALLSHVSNDFNNAFGAGALFSDQTGSENEAFGDAALISNIDGVGNVAVGDSAMSDNVHGNNNTAVGRNALVFNTVGYENTANGYQALQINTGAGNTAVGYLAGSALTTGDDNIDIGNDGVAGEAGTIRIGRSFIGATYIAGIFGASVGGTPVQVTGAGQLGTAPSSARFKDEIKPMDKTSEAILALRSVTFRYKKKIDPQGIQQWGLVAEDVQRVNPALVALDKEGRPYAVRYDQVNAMLLNEFLKEHRKMEEQDCKLQEQGAMIARQQKQIEALTAGLQKVSAQLELSKPATRTVLNQ